MLDDSNDGAITAGGATAPRFPDVAVGSAGGAGALGGALGSGCAYLGKRVGAARGGVCLAPLPALVGAGETLELLRRRDGRLRLEV